MTKTARTKTVKTKTIMTKRLGGFEHSTYHECPVNVYLFNVRLVCLILIGACFFSSVILRLYLRCVFLKELGHVVNVLPLPCWSSKLADR